jgi:hypothetical protein
MPRKKGYKKVYPAKSTESNEITTLILDLFKSMQRDNSNAGAQMQDPDPCSSSKTVL